MYVLPWSENITEIRWRPLRCSKLIQADSQGPNLLSHDPGARDKSLHSVHFRFAEALGGASAALSIAGLLASTHSHPPTNNSFSHSQSVPNTSITPIMSEPPAKKRKMESDGIPEKKSPTTSPSPEPDSVALKSLPAPTPAQYTRGGLVTLLIRPEEQELVVHGHLLAKTSEFFEAALKKEWKEDQTRTVRLPEEDMETTAHYLDFVCGQGFPTKAIMRYEDIKEEDGEEYLLLARLYAFGQRVLDKAVRNAIIEEILRLVSLEDADGTNMVPYQESISVIYQCTSTTSPARRLLVDLHARYGIEESMDSGPYDPIYLSDLVRTLTGRVRETREDSAPGLTAEDYLV
jgi:hypothetical protein